MRLFGLNNQQDQMREEGLIDLQNQKNFGKLLDHIIFEFEDTGAQIVPTHHVKCFQAEEEGIDFICPNGHDPILMQSQY